MMYENLRDVKRYFSRTLTRTRSLFAAAMMVNWQTPQSSGEQTLLSVFDHYLNYGTPLSPLQPYVLCFCYTCSRKAYALVVPNQVLEKQKHYQVCRYLITITPLQSLF